MFVGIPIHVLKALVTFFSGFSVNSAHLLPGQKGHLTCIRRLIQVCMPLYQFL